ncbi:MULTISPECIES: MarR family winged helix-turn-helix transcriptional regulator [Actinomadura]|uniref:MarR family winged helix-turn-helix transcriptional regulator n=1 Tax=Actinomadura TaxID=1988 RepID=UPI0004009B1F|nr:MarR family transcriptional regulator [Actinomadura madurae]SPT62965.1 Benzoate anaerobic degradation regulator [Actinomadura madurae]
MSENRSAAAAAVDADLETMVQLTARMMRGIKGGHDGAEELVDRVRAAGLGPRHVPALIQLVLHGPMAVGVLARRMALSPATVSQLVGELERGGFVERRPDERDRRRMIVSLGERHREMVERFTWRRLRPFRMALEALTPDERAQFLHGWRVLVETIERTSAPAPDGEGCPGG